MFRYVKEEKRILQEMSHPFIITMIAAFQDVHSLYMVRAAAHALVHPIEHTIVHPIHHGAGCVGT